MLMAQNLRSVPVKNHVCVFIKQNCVILVLVMVLLKKAPRITY